MVPAKGALWVGQTHAHLKVTGTPCRSRFTSKLFSWAPKQKEIYAICEHCEPMSALALVLFLFV